MLCLLYFDLPYELRPSSLCFVIHIFSSFSFTCLFVKCSVCTRMLCVFALFPHFFFLLCYSLADDALCSVFWTVCYLCAFLPIIRHSNEFVSFKWNYKLHYTFWQQQQQEQDRSYYNFLFSITLFQAFCFLYMSTPFQFISSSSSSSSSIHSLFSFFLRTCTRLYFGCLLVFSQRS